MIIASDLLDLAGQLAARADRNEAMARASVSRAYYAAFHRTSSFFKTMGLERVAHARNHALMPQCLLASEHTSLVEVARVLNALQRWRVIADDRLDSTDMTDGRRIRHHVESASQVFQRLDEFDSEDLSAAADNMTGYLARRGI